MHIQSVGFKDMAEAQVTEFMNFCCHALNLAANLMDYVDGGEEIMEETEGLVESLIEIFGGNALILQKSHESSDSEPESD